MYIATGQYIKFWENFYTSMNKNFLPTIKKEYYVFTDSKTFTYSNNPDIHIKNIKKERWPYNTLFRFKYFSGISSELENYDYVYFLNSNVVITKRVSENDIIPDYAEKETNYVFTIHPGYYAKKNEMFPVETNYKSKAYIDIKKYNNHHYVCGGFFGAKSKYFIEMSKHLDNQIQDDINHKIMAKWHDESHLNQFTTILNNKSYRYLNPSFCHPEDWNLPYEMKIKILEKKHYITLKKLSLYDLFKKKLNIFLKSKIK